MTAMPHFLPNLSLKSKTLAFAVAALALSGCARTGEIDIQSGVGVTASRTACPAVGVPLYTGDVTLFNPAGSRDSRAIDVTAAITNVRPACNDQGEKIYSVATFDVLATRRDAGPARQVTLPYYSTVVQGGTFVVSKRLGQITINFADGQTRAQATAKAAAFIDRAAATLPQEIRDKITRRRKAGDADAALDPMADPEVKAAVAKASFELLVGFQLTDDQLQYNATR